MKLRIFRSVGIAATVVALSSAAHAGTLPPTAPRPTAAPPTPAKPTVAAPRDAAAELAGKITTARSLITKRKTEADQARVQADPLSTDRRTKEKERAAQQKSFEKHAKAAGAAYKKYETAATKTDPKPPASEHLEASRTEYQAAATDGAMLAETTKAVRAKEDALADLVKSSADGAEEAKTAAADVKNAATELVKLAKDASADASRAATEAKTALRKTRTKTGYSSKESFGRSREKALARDQAFATTLSDAEKALAEVNAAIAARKPAAPPATPVAAAGGPPKPDKPKPQESLFANGMSATGVQTGGDGRAGGGDEQRRHRSTQAPTRPGAERKK
ncbi:MAG TPA: hypothetical protein VHE30_13880 [Polyangiaceae bacterium]|nr:hypothetical protein [Polyangiaceae bacterium]